MFPLACRERVVVGHEPAPTVAVAAPDAGASDSGPVDQETQHGEEVMQEGENVDDDETNDAEMNDDGSEADADD